MSYSDFKSKVLGKVIGDGQCVSLVVNNSNAYVEYLYPGVSWPSIMAPVVGAKDLAGKSNGYLTWIANDHNNPNQVPAQGDIMVFGATPQSGYTNTYDNPAGHTGICESASASGYVLLQQNAPAFGEVVNAKEYAWKFRPCEGWYHPTATNNPAPSPTPAPSGHTITLPATTGPWHAYPVGGPYTPNPSLPLLWPSKFGGLTYNIVNNRGNGIYTIQTQDFGQRDLFTNGSYVIVK
jgi:hypothetical protein